MHLDFLHVDAKPPVPFSLEFPDFRDAQIFDAMMQHDGSAQPIRSFSFFRRSVLCFIGHEYKGDENKM